MSRLHPILIDNREKDPDPDTWASSLSQLGVSNRVGQCYAGDFQWTVEPDGEGEEWLLVVVERKSIADLLTSAEDGRLAHFLEVSGGVEPDANTYRYLLVEGNQFLFSSYGHKEWTPEALDNLLLSVQGAGVHIVRSRGASHSPDRLAALYRYTGRPEHRTLTRVVRPEISQNYLDENVRREVRFLMGLPNIGEDRAKALLRKFGSVGAVLAAAQERDVKAFKEVKGVGSGIVKAIAEFLEA